MVINGWSTHPAEACEAGIAGTSSPVCPRVRQLESPAVCLSALAAA
jgi:hypothetical protein